MTIDSVDIASIFVALIAAMVSLATHRASTKAAKLTVETTSRVDLEKEAYQRARGYDTETIQRQEREIDELREMNELLRTANEQKYEEISLLKEEVRELKSEVRELKKRVLPAEDLGEN